VRYHRPQFLMAAQLELAWQRPEQGFGKLFKRLRRMGHGADNANLFVVLVKVNDDARMTITFMSTTT